MIINKAKEIKKINIIFALMVCAGFFLTFFTPFINAESNPFVHAFAEKVVNAGIGVITETIKGEGPFGALYDTCCDMDAAGVTDIYNDLVILGGTIALAIGISHIFQNIERNQDPVEAVFKTLVELFITFLFLMNVKEIMGAIMQAGKWIVSRIGEAAAGSSGASADDLLIALTGDSSGSFIWAIKATVSLIFPWILSCCIDIAAKFVIIQIMLEIIIRQMFAPLAIVDIYQEGLRSPGARYIKKFFATFIKLAICAFVALFVQSNLSQTITTGDAGGALDSVFTLVAVNFAAIGLMFKGGEFANDIVGA